MMVKLLIILIIKLLTFNFERSDFNLTNLNSDIVVVNKLQETSTLVLFYCLNNLFSLKLNVFKNIDFSSSVYNCSRDGLGNLYKRALQKIYYPNLYTYINIDFIDDNNVLKRKSQLF